jgi:hypothetical protein
LEGGLHFLERFLVGEGEQGLGFFVLGLVVLDGGLEGEGVLGGGLAKGFLPFIGYRFDFR